MSDRKAASTTNRQVALDLTGQELGAAAHRLELINGEGVITEEEHARVVKMAAWLRTVQDRVTAELRQLRDRSRDVR